MRGRKCSFKLSLFVCVILVTLFSRGVESCYKNNGNCDTAHGETCATCPGECGNCGGGCGDGTCSSSESMTSCPEDCGYGTCGDGICINEISSCYRDCIFCGNDICESGEECNCEDCGCDCASSNCRSCWGSPTTCTSCYSPYSLFGSECVSVCPLDTVDVGGVCRACASSCMTCSGNTTNCTTCKSEFVQDGFSCVTSCPEPKINITGNCLECTDNCATCSGSLSNCTSCSGDNGLDNNTCVITCSNGNSIINNTCTSCTANCTTCNGTQATCTSCSAPFSLDDAECVERCKSGYTSVDNICIACNLNCSTCLGSVSTCTSCSNGLFLLGTRCVTECPFGAANINNKCEGICRDGTCNSTLGENCLSCPFDCGYGRCGVCGDMHCDTTESCQSCPSDCTCSIGSVKCPTGKTQTGEAECSGHGTCNSANGLCACSTGFTGANCGEVNRPINVTTNSTTGGTFTITTPAADNSTNDSVQFNIALQNISEVTPSGVVVYSVNVSAVVFTITSANDTKYPTAKKWILEGKLPNKADVLIQIYLFQLATSFPFAGRTIQIGSSSVKTSITISNWAFRSLQNSLNVTLISNGSSPTSTKGCGEQQPDTNNAENVQWTYTSSQGISLYSSFVDLVEIDSRPRKIAFKYLNGKVMVLLPHFWDTAVIDPVYSVLLSNERRDLTECDEQVRERPKNKTSTAVIVGATVGVVGAAIIVAAALLAFQIHKKRIFLQKTRVKL